MEKISLTQTDEDASEFIKNLRFWLLPKDCICVHFSYIHPMTEEQLAAAPWLKHRHKDSQPRAGQ